MAVYQYMVDRRLKAHEVRDLEVRSPICQVCSDRLERIAVRELAFPHHWQPIGWMCWPCSLMLVAEGA